MILHFSDTTAEGSQLKGYESNTHLRVCTQNERNLLMIVKLYDSRSRMENEISHFNIVPQQNGTTSR